MEISKFPKNIDDKEMKKIIRIYKKNNTIRRQDIPEEYAKKFMKNIMYASACRGNDIFLKFLYEKFPHLFNNEMVSEYGHYMSYEMRSLCIGGHDQATCIREFKITLLKNYDKYENVFDHIAIYDGYGKRCDKKCHEVKIYELLTEEKIFDDDFIKKLVNHVGFKIFCKNVLGKIYFSYKDYKHIFDLMKYKGEELFTNIKWSVYFGGCYYATPNSELLIFFKDLLLKEGLLDDAHQKKLELLGHTMYNYVNFCLKKSDPDFIDIVYVGAKGLKDKCIIELD